jgi:hypothetical protein
MHNSYQLYRYEIIMVVAMVNHVIIKESMIEAKGLAGSVATTRSRMINLQGVLELL